MNEEQRKALMQHLLSGNKARIHWEDSSNIKRAAEVRFGFRCRCD